jgi:hypothetical protein
MLAWEFSMGARLDSIDISVLVLIMVLALIAVNGAWGRGWRPPRGPF